MFVLLCKEWFANKTNSKQQTLPKVYMYFILFRRRGKDCMINGVAPLVRGELSAEG